jgi:hypothetical protein
MKYVSGVSLIIHASLKLSAIDGENCVGEFKITEQGAVALLESTCIVTFVDRL